MKKCKIVNPFGERMDNVLFNGFKYGYDNLIDFGGDCRYLNESLLLNANQ